MVAYVNPRPGELLAEIGASSGYNAAMMGVFTDGAIYYLHDNDSNCLNYYELDKVLRYYSDFKGRSIKRTSQFYISIGNGHETGLKEQFFDKIYSNMVMHTFENPLQLLQNMHAKLKDGGSMFIRDGFDHTHDDKSCPNDGCTNDFIPSDAFIEMAEHAGFEYIESNTSYEDHPILKFSK